MTCARGVALGCALLATALAHPTTARAQVTPTHPLPARVRLARFDCPQGPFEFDPFVSQLRVELASDGVERVEVDPVGASPDPTGVLSVLRLEVPECTERASAVTVTIDDVLTHKSVRRVIELGDIARSARARVLALAVAELFRATWAELAIPEAPVSASVAPALSRAITLRLGAALRDTLTAPAPTPARETPMATHAWSLGAGVELRSFPGLGASLLGARATASWRPFRSIPLSFRVDAGALSGTALDPLGEISIAMASGALGASLTAHSDAVRFELGPTLEAGVAWGRSRPNDAQLLGTTFSERVAIVALDARVSVRALPRVWVYADLSVGIPLLGVVINASGRRSAGIEGPMLGVNLGATFDP